MPEAARKLDRRVSFLAAILTKDEFNVDVETWAPFATVPAAVTPVSDGERVRAAEVAASISARVLTRWSPALAALTPANRVRHEGRDYNIVNKKELGRRQWLEFSVEARAE